MPRTKIGESKVLTAHVTTLVSGSSSRPWVVFMSSDSGIWPIEQHATRKAAMASAKRLNAEEDKRCAMINHRRALARAKTDREPIPRGLFTDYFVKRFNSE